MTSDETWRQIRDRRMTEPGAADAYEAARLAFELGAKVREIRLEKGWTQEQLASAAGMVQPTVARLEAGGTVPTLPVLQRLAHALGTELSVTISPHRHAA